jgi:mRNA interferase MazF
VADIGEIRWADLPATGGHEQAGQRPVIVVQDDGPCSSLPTTVVVPLTTNLASSRFPCTIVLQPDAGNRLPQPSVALVFQAPATDRRRLRSQLGKLSDADIRRLAQALRSLLHLP